MSVIKQEVHPDWVYYFAYNLHMDTNCFADLNLDFIDEGLAVLPEYTLMFNVLQDELFLFEKCGLANIVPQTGKRVEGGLYRIHGHDLPKLDVSSGVLELKYYRKSVRVQSVKAEKVEAFTYVGWPDKTSSHLVPSAKYLNQLAFAAAQIPTSQRFQKWLGSHPTIT